jgi:hypothetical protein
MSRGPGRPARGSSIVPNGRDVVPNIVIAQTACLLLRGYARKPGDSFASRKFATDSGTRAVMVYAE